jgi:hypothetical protein
MRRVVIVGSGGSGKTTLADELARRTGLPVIHLDEHFWHPGWLETPRDVWRAIQQELFAGDEWIADGNYSATLDERLPRADTVILCDFPTWRTLPAYFGARWGTDAAPCRPTCTFCANPVTSRRSSRRHRPVDAQGGMHRDARCRINADERRRSGQARPGQPR